MDTRRKCNKVAWALLVILAIALSMLGVTTVYAESAHTTVVNETGVDGYLATVSGNGAATTEEELLAECERMTDRTIEENTDDLDDLFSYIPKAVFWKSSYQFVGKNYGFVTYSSFYSSTVQEGLLGYYMVTGLVFKVSLEHKSDKNTLIYTLDPVTNISTRLYLKINQETNEEDLVYSPETKRTGNGIGYNKYYLSDIETSFQINTINQEKINEKGYDVKEDNSYYLEYIDSTSCFVNENQIELKDYLIYGGFRVLDLVLGIAHLDWIPLEELHDLATNRFSVTQDGRYYLNMDNYETQVANGQLASVACIRSDKGQFLRSSDNDNSKIQYILKYDNKLHSAEDMQVAVDLKFNIRENINLDGVKSTYNANRTKVYNFFNEDIIKLECKSDGLTEDNVELTGEKVHYIYDNGHINQIKFRSNQTRHYRFNAEGSKLTYKREEVKELFIVKNNDYVFDIAFGEEKFTRIGVEAVVPELTVSDEQLNEGLSKFTIRAEENDVHKLYFNTQIDYAVVNSQGDLIYNCVNKAYIDELFAGGEEYTVYIYNDDYVYDFNMEYEHSAGLPENFGIASDGYAYYRYETKYRAEYEFDINSAYEIYDENFNLVRIADNTLLSERNSIYFIKIYGNGNIVVCSDRLKYEVISLGKEYNILNVDRDNVFGIRLDYECSYKFTAETDIYDENRGLVAEGVNEAYLGAGWYYVVERGDTDSYKISFKTADIAPGETIGAVDKNMVYRYTCTDTQYIDIDCANAIALNNRFEEIEYDYGYEANGELYILVYAGNSLSIDEFLLEVNITLVYEEDAECNADSVTVRYRGDYTLPVPKREGYTFNVVLPNACILQEI